MTGIIEKLSLVEIGARVEHIRKDRGVSMADMGMAMGKTTRDAANSLVKNIELGARKTLNNDQVSQILHYFDMSEAEFLALDLNSPKTSPLLDLIPDLADHFEALRLAQKIGDPGMVKSVLKGIRDRIDKEINT